VTSCTVLQPTYLGWVGYYDLIDRADVCVLYDTCAVDRQSWQTRNRIRARDGQTVWLTVPVHAHMGQELHHVEIAGGNWRQKHLRTLRSAYGHTPHWKTVEALVSPFYDADWKHLADLTASLIVATAARLRSQTPILRASQLGATRAGRVERLVDLCRLVEADTLIEPAGGGYLADADLDGIRLEWHDYRHPVYEQGGREFVSHLSVIDLIAHCGDDSPGIIRNSF
jgi:hypothetical protein